LTQRLASGCERGERGPSGAVRADVYGSAVTRAKRSDRAFWLPLAAPVAGCKLFVTVRAGAVTGYGGFAIRSRWIVIRGWSDRDGSLGSEIRWRFEDGSSSTSAHANSFTA